jgi:hypothetical protein
MTKNAKCSFRNVIRKFLKVVLLLFLMKNTSASYAQEQEFKLLSEENILHFRYEPYAESIGLFFYYIPPELKYRKIVVSGGGSCWGIHEIDANTFVNKQVRIDLCSNWKHSDTIFFSLQEEYSGINYLPIKIILGISSTEVKMGANCYVIQCEPNNDPWMPSSHLPYLFSSEDYYVNPKNGKARKGKTWLNSAVYTPCDFENWELVYADQIDAYRTYWKAQKKRKK